MHRILRIAMKRLHDSQEFVFSKITMIFNACVNIEDIHFKNGIPCS